MLSNSDWNHPLFFEVILDHIQVDIHEQIFIAMVYGINQCMVAMNSMDHVKGDVCMEHFSPLDIVSIQGKNMDWIQSTSTKWSHDGYLYLIGYGSNSSFPTSPTNSFSIESWNGVEYIRRLEDVDKAQPLFTFANETGKMTAF